MTRYLRPEKIAVEKIVDELFDLTTLGAVSIPDVLTVQAKTELLAALKDSRHLFKQVQREMRSGVIQEMETLYLHTVAKDQLPHSLRQSIGHLTDEYQELYQKIAIAARFSPPTFNSIGIHRYFPGSLGITPHQDFSVDSNLVASFVVAGKGRFYVCRDRQKTDAVGLPTEPGTIILMRAARTEEEQTYRPFHYLEGPIEEERYSILIRNRVGKE